MVHAMTTRTIYQDHAAEQHREPYHTGVAFASASFQEGFNITTHEHSRKPAFYAFANQRPSSFAILSRLLAATRAVANRHEASQRENC